jgi:tetratricopeptide (TPR) repeat protein
MTIHFMKKLALIILLQVVFSIGFSQDSLDPIRKKIQAKDYAGAKADLSKLIDANPKNKIALNLRGTVRLNMDDLYGAIADFTYALEIDSTYAEALNNRGEAKMNLSDDDGAIADLD